MCLNFGLGGVRMHFVNKADPLGLNSLLVVEVPGPQHVCRKEDQLAKMNILNQIVAREFPIDLLSDRINSITKVPAL